MFNIEAIAEDLDWSAVIITKPVGMTPKEFRWWLERQTKGRFSVRESRPKSSGRNVVKLWPIMSWQERQRILLWSVMDLDPERNHSGKNATRFAFEQPDEAMLFKLTFANSL